VLIAMPKTVTLDLTALVAFAVLVGLAAGADLTPALLAADTHWG
jgi:hypothetical protein